MAHDVFISYSSKDAGPAEAICRALESTGMRCWIAPRDIVSGSQWGGSIINAIQASKAVLIVFSEHANASPQIVRELEAAVDRRLPLIPVRIVDLLPTEDMQYFLGVSHWLNAYPKAIESYLPQIVESTRKVLDGQRQSWRNRLPQTRRGQLILGALAVLAVAFLTAWLMKPKTFDPMEAMRSPLSGRWQLDIPDASGKKQTCVLDVQDMGQYAFADSCPIPLAGNRGNFATTKDGAYAPNVFRRGTDDGSFMMQNFSGANTTGSYRRVSRSELELTTAQFGSATWDRNDDTTPLKNDADSVLAANATWPLHDVPAIAERATKYMQSKWQPDAMLMRITLKPQQSGVDASFLYYSPSQQAGMLFNPNSSAGSLFPNGAMDANVGQSIPLRFIDLPDAIAQLQRNGMRGKQISEAELEWSSGPPCGTGNFRIDNAILPKCPPGPRFQGAQWQIDSALGERRYLPAY